MGIYDKLSPEEWAEPIDFGFQLRIVKHFDYSDQAYLYNKELVKKWDVVVPDLSSWPPVKGMQKGLYAWRVKNKSNNN